MMPQHPDEGLIISFHLKIFFAQNQKELNYAFDQKAHFYAITQNT